MRNHSEFVHDLQAIAVGPSEVVGLMDIIRLSRGGVAPEGLGTITTNGIVDSIYKLNMVGSGQQQQNLTAPPETVPPKPQYHLGGASQGKLAFLLPQLVKVVERAIELTTVDFAVTETIRTLEEQKAKVASGNSRTMQSLHLKQPDGFAHAVDLAAWKDGKISWVDDFYAAIAFAMDRAATEQGVAQHIRWGGAWDRRLSDFGGSLNAYFTEIQDYRKRHAGSDLIDQPHFEWHD